jgi:hypothetical protein
MPVDGLLAPGTRHSFKSMRLVYELISTLTATILVAALVWKNDEASFDSLKHHV